jgi:hypothetical protein
LVGLYLAATSLISLVGLLALRRHRVPQPA